MNLAGEFRSFLAVHFRYPKSHELMKFVAAVPRMGISRRFRTNRTSLYKVDKVMDISRYSAATLTSGIPRVVAHLVKRAADEGVTLAVWHKGRLVPVECDGSGKVTFPPQHWRKEPSRFSLQKIYMDLMRIRPWFAILGAAFSIPLVRLIGNGLVSLFSSHWSGVPRSSIPLRDMTYFLPEVPDAETSDRLSLALQYEEDFEISILVHDLLPVSHPQHFDAASNSEFLLYLQLVVRARSLVAGSPVLRNQLELFASSMGLSEKPTIHIHDLPIDNSPLDMVLSAAPNAVDTALFIGAFQSRKGLDVAGSLFARGGMGNLVLAVVGVPKPTNPLEMSLFRQLKLLENVRLLGALSDQELWSEFSKAEVVVYLSAAEGYGLPVLEGLSAGKPVVCIDTPINRYFQVKYGGIFLIPHKLGNFSETDLASALGRAVNEKYSTPDNLPLHPSDWASAVFSDVFSGKGCKR